MVPAGLWDISELAFELILLYCSLLIYVVLTYRFLLYTEPLGLLVYICECVLIIYDEGSTGRMMNVDYKYNRRVKNVNPTPSRLVHFQILAWLSSLFYSGLSESAP